MKKTMFIVAAVSGLLWPICFAVYHFTQLELFETLMITAATVFYHFAMRLAVGYAVNGIVRNKVDHDRWWFRERGFERKLYKLLKVKNWKGRMPTFNESLFDLSQHSSSEIMGAMCQAEVVHEIIILLSFVPLLFTLWWGTPLVFIITSVAAALFDSTFVIMQRYNRPRIQKLLNRKKQ